MHILYEEIWYFDEFFVYNNNKDGNFYSWFDKTDKNPYIDMDIGD